MKSWGRFEALVIVFVLASTGASMPQAISAVKAGSSCKKQGEFITVSSRTYTCIKSGKKLVWDKGVPVKKTSIPAQNSAAPSKIPVVAQVSPGDACSSMGKQIKNDKYVLECRKIVGNRMVYFSVKNDFSPITNPNSPEPHTTCRIADMRTNKPQAWSPSIAFPPNPAPGWNATGTYKIVVVGVDFSDFAGTGSVADLYENDLKMARNWFNWYSNGKVKYEFTVNPNWIRVPKESWKYEQNAALMEALGKAEGKETGLTDAQRAEDYVQAIAKTTDLSNTASIWVYHPLGIQTIYGQMLLNEVKVTTPNYGVVTANIYATGGDTYDSKRVRWGFFIHELMHRHGLFGHAPKIPWLIGIMSGANGWSEELLTVDAQTLGWSKSEDIYCVNKSTLTSVDLKLVPIEREQEGLRAAQIKLNDHQLITVESHHKDKWSFGLSPGSYGVMVYFTDTTISTTWDNVEGFANPSSTSVYLKVDNAQHGNYVSWGEKITGKQLVDHSDVGVINGIGIQGDKANWDLNYMMYEGESITFKGIKVTLIQSGDNDTVRIQKVG